MDVGILGDVRQLRPDLFVREWDRAIATKPGSSLVVPAHPGELVSPELVNLWLIDMQASKDETRAEAWLFYIIAIAYYFKIEPAFLIVALGSSMEAWCIRQIRQHKRLRAEENVRVIGPSTLAGKSPANLRIAAAMALIYRRKAHRKLVEYTVDGLRSLRGPDDIDYIRMVLAAIDPLLAKEVTNKMEREYEMGEIELESYFYTHGVSVGRAEGHAEGRAEGRAEGLAQAVLTLLQGRGVETSERLQTALGACHDVDLLARLVTRAHEVQRADELLAELPPPTH